ncbi:hypothetical protein [Roseisolibacter agri]|uniref:Uncharacterized protein n=1 Tax=Roseisolibacter agri TaxID=2014610 RepID=A0AA37QBE4_9BACT|nr:hypothetical protein [Roseisolibacter agri]GLC25806.1 hypothetical protein rosag_23190 [Roseisolibacter agri]
MSDRPDPRPDPAVAAASPERRRNAALRELVDEMLASIRTAANRDLWTPDERQQYESELALIMNRVRAEAMNREKGAS